MAETPDHITITVDEVALRKQIDGIVQECLQAASWKLRQAADNLEPDFMKNLMEEQKTYWRKEWDAEQAKETQSGK